MAGLGNVPESHYTPPPFSARTGLFLAGAQWMWQIYLLAENAQLLAGSLWSLNSLCLYLSVICLGKLDSVLFELFADIFSGNVTVNYFCIKAKVISKYLEVKDGKPNKYDC